MSFDMNENDINNYIDAELNKFKFNKTSLGYKYLKIAIKYGIQDELLIENLNNRLYNKIEKELMIDKKKIKWNIEKSIETMFINTDIKYITHYFYIEEKERVTPKMFITTIVENYFK